MKPETKDKVIKILHISMWSLLCIGFLVSLGFVERKQNSFVCKNLNINIDRDDEVYFVQKEDVRQLLKNRGDAIIDQPVQTINIPQIEKVINSHPSVSTAEVYMDVNGALNIDITQRKPLVRVINENNESYYIDTAGKLMPLSENYSAKVFVVNGHVKEPFSKLYMYSMEEVMNTPALRDSTLLDELFVIAQYINADNFWKSQIQQLYVNEENEFELIPRVGDHLIILGDVTDIDEKFEKLMIFYKEAMNKTGWWNNYSIINLKYKDQIVCTKKSDVTSAYARTEPTQKMKEKEYIQENVTIKRAEPIIEKKVSRSLKKKKRK